MEKAVISVNRATSAEAIADPEMKGGIAAGIEYREIYPLPLIGPDNVDAIQC